jgi:hypothetical protein
MSQSAPELLAAIAAFKKEHENDRSQLECCENLSKVETSLGKADAKPSAPEDQSTPDVGDIKALRAAAAKRAGAYTADLPERNPEIERPKDHSKAEDPRGDDLHNEAHLAKLDAVKELVGRGDSENAPSWGSKNSSEEFKRKAKDWMTQRQGSEA